MNNSNARARFSPETKWFLQSAAWLAGVYLLASLIGWRKYTSVLAATVSGTEAFLGMFYLFLHFIFIVLVPILVIAGGLNLLLERKRSGASVR
ncbi:MAG: hypothetical protein ACPGVU_14205 [Limisphaerales bacterium]